MIHTFKLSAYALLMLVAVNVRAQLKLGNNSTNINEGSLLELGNATSGTQKGLLLPRTALSAANVWGLGGTPTAGMVVYNTATSGTGVNAISPGICQYDGRRWVNLTEAANKLPALSAQLDSLLKKWYSKLHNCIIHGNKRGWRLCWFIWMRIR